MLGKDTKLREIAAEGARQRIRFDREHGASVRIKPLLNYIEQHLFDPELTSPKLMRECNVRNHSIATVFTREIEATPTDYIRDRRMETAMRLLSDTDLPIWKVGDLVFSDDLPNFSSKFKRWAGSPPTVFRVAARRAAAETESVDGDLRRIAEAILRGGLEELTLDQLDHLIRHLEAMREAQDPAAPPPLAIDGAGFERGMALAHWERLRHLPPGEQKAVVRQPYAPRTTALFDLLREKSREEGRKDRQTGVRLAELALASLDGIAVHLAPEELANKKAQGWAWLANARRLALDYPAAERGFVKALRLLPADPDPLVLAEICALEGELYLFQSKLKEALGLKDRAVEIFQSLGDEEALAAGLISRASTIGQARGWEFSIPDLLAALKLLDSKSQPYLTLVAYHNLLLVYALCGQSSEAIARLPEARVLCERVDDPSVTYHFQWTEGLIRKVEGEYEAAERQVLSAHDGFASLGESAYVAATDLELAELSLQLGRPSRAASHALRAIPVFESFKIHPDAMAGLAILAKVAAENEIRLEMIREIRSHLQRLLRHPINSQNERAALLGPLLI
jgi:AraC-like DNA-binding protein